METEQYCCPRCDGSLTTIDNQTWATPRGTQPRILLYMCSTCPPFRNRAGETQQPQWTELELLESIEDARKGHQLPTDDWKEVYLEEKGRGTPGKSASSKKTGRKNPDDKKPGYARMKAEQNDWAGDLSEILSRENLADRKKTRDFRPGGLSDTLRDTSEKLGVTLSDLGRTVVSKLISDVKGAA